MERENRFANNGACMAALCRTLLHTKRHPLDASRLVADPWLQKRENQAPWDDVKRNLYFLYSQGTPIKEKRTRVLPFDYASVYIANGKIQFCFTRGRGELNVSLSPRHAPDDAYELAVVVAALDSKDITKLAQLNDLASVGDLLRARLDELNHVFSESSYSEFKRKLLKVKENVRILTREAEWELNRGLYR